MRTKCAKEAVLNLEQQNGQARELLRAIGAGEAEGLSRLRRPHGRWAGVDDATIRQEVSLHDAQSVLAREQGFTSWSKLKAYAGPSSDVRHTKLFVADVEWITGRGHVLCGRFHVRRSGRNRADSRVAPRLRGFDG